VTVSQKAALSLLITVVLFAGFTVLAFTGLFDLVESRFYNPAITSALNREVNAEAQVVDKFLAEMENRFAFTLQDAGVKRSFLPNQSAEDIFERSRIFGVLLDSLGGFQGVRFIDSGGSRIHYSTYPQDILSQDRLSIAYRNYDGASLPYSRIASANQAGLKLILDEAEDRILFSLPFYDSFDVFRGTALFSLSIRAIADRLISEGRINVGENVSVLSEPAGIVLGMPLISENALVPKIASVWNDGILSLTSMDSVSEVSLALISVKTSHNFFVGSLVNEDRFVFPQLMRMILLAAFFLTLYLTIFLLFNLRQDSFTIVQNRLKQLQISLIEQYYERKSDMDWGHWSRELEQRREEIRDELKRGIKPEAKSKGDKNDIDALIDKSWDELLTVIGGPKDKAAAIDEEKLQTILNRILSAGVSIPAPAPGSAAETPAPVQAVSADAEPMDDLEELTEAEPADAVEELSEAEPMDDLEELTEAEPADAVEELTEAEPADAVEELTDAGDAGKVEELEELEELDESAEGIPAGEAPAPSPQRMSGLDLANLASQIEFSELPVEEGEDTAPEKEVEIVSPFATMLSDFSAEEAPAEGGEKKKPAGKKATIQRAQNSQKNQKAPENAGPETVSIQHGMSVLYKPFVYTCVSDPEPLESLPDEDDAPEILTLEDGEPDVIEEHEGVHYISKEALSPDTETEKNLNPDFKNLVDSVIK
jgi:hypothetical protein